MNAGKLITLVIVGAIIIGVLRFGSQTVNVLNAGGTQGVHVLDVLAGK